MKQLSVAMKPAYRNKLWEKMGNEFRQYQYFYYVLYIVI